MTLQTIRELMVQRPFKPFRLIMSSGQAFDVCHPEMAMLTRTSLLVGIGDAGDHIPSEFKICTILNVEAIKPISSEPTQNTGP